MSSRPPDTSEGEQRPIDWATVCCHTLMTNPPLKIKLGEGFAIIDDG